MEDMNINNNDSFDAAQSLKFSHVPIRFNPNKVKCCCGNGYPEALQFKQNVAKIAYLSVLIRI